MKDEKIIRRERRKNKIRKKLFGTSNCPRLSVFCSNKHTISQIIDDSLGKTLVYASDLEKNVEKGTKTEMARFVGKAIAKKAKSKKIERVVFDRGGRKYHGRIKALADTAREEGLKF